MSDLSGFDELAEATNQPGPRFAMGGTVPNSQTEGDSISCVLSPCRWATRRPGETPSQAMNRLMEGEDL